jgi:Rhamnan synthesis protein F
MSLLTVFAHFDPEGLVAPYVERYLQALAAESSRLVVVSTAPLTEKSRARLTEIGQLVERDNTGYDFHSWRAGLLEGDAWGGYDRLLLTNDSTVGPVRPLPEILAAMDATGCDVLGVTASEVIEPHLQSYFLLFDGSVAHWPQFQAFWAGMPTVSERGQVIRRYELGLSRLLRAGGFTLDSLFHPTAWDRRVASVRAAKAAATAGSLPGLVRAVAAQSVARAASLTPADPSLALADRVLPDGRLPLLKLRFLREDPFGVGAERVLSLCEQQFPTVFDGVRDHVLRTAPTYLRSRKPAVQAAASPDASPVTTRSG